MKASILIIDDDLYVVNLLEKYLQREGHKVFTSFKGEPALKLLHKETIDVALCDIRLPDINGTELLPFIRQISPNTAVIMMTAYAEIRSAVDSIKAGAFDYVTKPISPEEICNIINRATKRKSKKPAASENVFITGDSTIMSVNLDRIGLYILLFTICPVMRVP